MCLIFRIKVLLASEASWKSTREYHPLVFYLCAARQVPGKSADDCFKMHHGVDKAAKRQMHPSQRKGNTQLQHTTPQEQKKRQHGQKQHQQKPRANSSSVPALAGQKSANGAPANPADVADEEDGEGERKIPRSGVARVIAAHDRLREARIMQVSG